MNYIKKQHAGRTTNYARGKQLQSPAKSETLKAFRTSNSARSLPVLLLQTLLKANAMSSRSSFAAVLSGDARNACKHVSLTFQIPLNDIFLRDFIVQELQSGKRVARRKSTIIRLQVSRQMRKRGLSSPRAAFESIALQRILPDQPQRKFAPSQRCEKEKKKTNSIFLLIILISSF